MRVGEKGNAMFVEFPFTWEDIRKPHPHRKAKSYEIVAHVELPLIEFENFITDMTEWREFIDQHGAKATVNEDGVYGAILVTACQTDGEVDPFLAKERDDYFKGGYLVTPNGNDYPRWVAYQPE